MSTDRNDRNVCATGKAVDSPKRTEQWKFSSLREVLGETAVLGSIASCQLLLAYGDFGLFCIGDRLIEIGDHMKMASSDHLVLHSAPNNPADEVRRDKAG